MFINNRYFLTHCFFSTKKKGVQEKIYRSARVLKEKFSIFIFKNNFSPKKPFPHDFLVTKLFLSKDVFLLKKHDLIQKPPYHNLHLRRNFQKNAFKNVKILRGPIFLKMPKFLIINYLSQLILFQFKALW